MDIDPLFRGVSFAAATLLLCALGGVVISLAIGGWPVLHKFGLGFFLSTHWDPVNDVYGAAGPIIGTLATSAIALILALPIAIGVAVFLSEFCPQFIARPIGLAVELLAGIPSIVYGMWGLFVLAPWFATNVQLPLMMNAPPGSIWETLFGGVPNGANILTASLILAVMILPYMSSVFRELLRTVPPQLREASYGMGATPYETVMSVVIPFVRRGAIGVVMLGLGRALGETMAVTFIIGNSHDLPTSVFSSGSTLASTIANEFAEASSDMHTSALLALGLVLFLITFTVLALARGLLNQKEA